MKFNQFYFKEDSVSYADLSNTFHNPKDINPSINATSEDMKNTPYDINPSRDNFMKILRHPMSTYNYGNKRYNVVRIGVDANYNVWIWPGFILHRVAARDIAKKPFVYRLHFDAGNPDAFLTDSPADYVSSYNGRQDDIREELEKLTSVLQKYLGFLGTRGITDWHSRGRKQDNLTLSFEKFGGKETDKNIDHEEPEYATIIRKFHSMEGYQIIKEESINPEIIRHGKEIADKLGILFSGVWEVIYAFSFTDPKTGSSFAANDFDEAKVKLKNMRDRFAHADANPDKKEMNQYYSMI